MACALVAHRSEPVDLRRRHDSSAGTSGPGLEPDPERWVTFELIKTIVRPAIVESDAKSIELRNAAGRRVRVEFASDPDICVREELPSAKRRNLVAIEIKGGKDISNIHNRIGEAEKSHQKARKRGFVECWTMVGVARLDLELARRESPSTDRFYSIHAVAQLDSDESHDFRDHVRSRVGVSDQETTTP